MQFDEHCAKFSTVLTDTARRAVPRRQLSFLRFYAAKADLGLLILPPRGGWKAESTQTLH